MSYEDKFGITEIREGRRDSLSISFDDMGEGIIPVFLHIPDKEEDEHSHIELNRDQAEILHKWLGNYLEEHK